MREIKFRAWDKKNKEMSQVVEMIFNQYGGIDVRTSRRMDINEDCLGKDSLMQFTGLKDKNGKEIYESDLVKSSKNIYEVVWNTECARWGLLKSNGKFPVAIHHGAKTLEVIGNVFKNKELLK